MFRSAFLTSILLSCVPSLALVYNVQKFIKPKSNHSLYLFSDLHNYEPSHPGITHSRPIIHFLRARKSTLIVEDVSNLTDEKKPLLELFQDNSYKRSSLKNLSSLAHHSGIPLVTNIEFRPDTDDRYKHIMLKKVISATNDVISEMEQWDDGPILNKYYQGCIARHKNIISPACKLFFKNIESLEEGCPGDIDKRLSEVEVPKEAYEVLYAYYFCDAEIEEFSEQECAEKIFMRYNSEIINAKTLHALAAHMKLKKVITAYIGRAHAREIESMLGELGFVLFEERCEPRKGGGVKPLNLPQRLHEIEPDYDPNEILPRTPIDYLLDYKEFKYRHPCITPMIAPALIAGTLLVIGCAFRCLIGGCAR